ncbi:MAG: LPS export ABC transporter permease LptF [Cycloclasticus sp. symbiont of Poecilosclerida sp. M]|nr:MAG: LPS export ABC transporter permease LptF [Cycloclasticus sp. symbiont of Poecilosclerida sp. M]
MKKQGLKSTFKLIILDRLFVVELSKMMASVIVILTTIMISRRLVRYLSEVTAGQLSSDAMLSLIGFNMFSVVIKILPVALLVSVLLVLGRMYRDNEMTALFSAGVSMTQLYRSLAFFVIPLFLITTYLSLFAMPWVMQQIEVVKVDDKSSIDIRGISDGRFIEYSRGDVVFYVEEITSDDKMVNVFIQNRQHGKLGITTSKSGEIFVDSKTGDRFMILKNGTRYEGVPGQADYKIISFEEYGVVIAETKKVEVQFGIKEMGTVKLLKKDSVWATSEFQKRVSTPLMLLIFALLAVPISRVSPRAGMYGNLLSALLIYIIYENLMNLSYSWIVKGVISPWVGVWWVHIFMMFFSFVMLAKFLGFRHLKKRAAVRKWR